MKSYEYKVIPQSAVLFSNEKELAKEAQTKEKLFNELGKEGWKLQEYNHNMMIFIREVNKVN